MTGEWKPLGAMLVTLLVGAGPAAGLGFLPIVATAISLFVINRVAGRRVGGMFGWERRPFTFYVR